MAIDIIPISEAWVTLEMIDELHNNLTILYESDQLEWLWYVYKDKWQDLIDLWVINSVFAPMVEEAYDTTDVITDDEDDEDIQSLHDDTPPEELEW